MNVLIVDDHAALRAALAEMLAGDTAVGAIWEARDGGEAIELAVKLRPDLVLMDVQMPGMDGIEATRTITRMLPATRVVALTSRQDHDAVAAMLRAGAQGYLVKTSPASALAAGVRAAITGGMVVAPEVVPGVLHDLVDHYQQQRDRADGLAAVARMQHEFVSRVTDELRNPLTVIRGSVNTLRSDGDRLDADVRDELLAQVDRQAARLARSVEQLLTVAGIHRGERDVLAHRVALDAVVREALDRLGDVCADRLEALEAESLDVVADRRGLVAVVLSLIENAMVHTNGTFRVHVARRGADEAEVAVIDGGPGADAPSLLRQMRQPFAAGDLSDTRVVGGLGLSLYIAGQVLEAAGGRLEIDTAPERGSTFAAVLPIA